MDPVLEQLPSRSRVAVVRLRSLGDCVLTTPALQLLKQYRPDLQIAVIVESRFRAVFEHNPDVEQLLPPHLPPLWAWRPRLCVNLHGGTRSLILTAGSGARVKAGFAHFRAPWINSVRIPTAQQVLGLSRKVHTAEHLACAMFALGVPVQTVPQARLFVSDPARPAGVPAGPFAVVHPFASQPEKTWPPERFVAVASHLLANWQITPVFLGGAGDDFTPFREFTCLQGLPLNEIKRAMRHASFFVGNDSGPAHLAAACSVPLVVLFGPSDADVWSPWKAHGEVLSAAGPVSSLPISQVLAAIERARVAA